MRPKATIPVILMKDYIASTISQVPPSSNICNFHDGTYRTDGSITLHWDFQHHLTLHLKLEGTQLVVRQQITIGEKVIPTSFPFSFGRKREIPFNEAGKAILEGTAADDCWRQVIRLPKN